VVRERRAVEIDQGVSTHLERGGAVLFVTGTTRHRAPDALAPRLAFMTTALQALLMGSPWKRRKEALGYCGAIRSIEVTWGMENGWHPHFHALLLFDQAVSDEARRELTRWLEERWVDVCSHAGMGVPSRRIGLDVRPVRSAGDLGQYLAKIDGGWGAGLEMARGDLKKKPGRLSPFGILEEFAATGDVAMRDLWLEYEEATFGRRAIRWGQGLKERLGVDLQVDEEAAAGPGGLTPIMRALVEAAAWNPMVKRGDVAWFLDDVEHLAAAVQVMASAYGTQLKELER
jgi:hypothetical protein